MWLIKDIASVNKDWFENKSHEEQLQWVESLTIPEYQKKELRGKCNGKRKGNIQQTEQVEPIDRKGKRSRDRSKKSTDKGGED